MAEEELAADAPAQLPEIVDPYNVPVTYVDWLVTAGEHEGVLNVVFGTIDHALKKPDDPLARIMIASRLRLSREFATRIHKMLGDVLGINPPGSAPNEEPPTTPKNRIH